MSLILMTSSSDTWRSDASGWLLIVLYPGYFLMSGMEFLFEIKRVSCHREAGYKEKDRNEHVNFRRQSLPLGIGQRCPSHTERIEQADNDDKRRIFIQADKGIHDPGNRNLQRLRQYNQTHRLPVFQSHRVGGFDLPLG